MMVTVKYVFIILRADNNGEGGTFSTYSLLSRYVRLPLPFNLVLELLNFLAEHYEPRPKGSFSD